MKTAHRSEHRPASRLTRRGTEIAFALLLLLYVLAVALSIAARLSVADNVTATGPAAGPDGLVALSGLALNQEWALVQYGATLAGAFLLTALSALAYRLFRVYDPTLALAGAFMFLGAAFFSGLSAIAGLVLAQGYALAVGSEAQLTSLNTLYLMSNTVEPLRALAGMVSFTFSGLALLILGGLTAWSGALPRWLGGLGILTGALMFFMWYADAAVLHRLGGAAYLLWLTLLAGWLLFRGTAITEVEESYV